MHMKFHILPSLFAANGLSPTTSYWFGQKDKETE